MKPLTLYVCAALFISGFAVAEQGPLDCDAPALSAPNFKSSVGSRAPEFQRSSEYGKRCRYVHPNGSVIRLEERNRSRYAADEYNAKKEEDTSKAQANFDLPKPVDVAGIGSAAYKLVEGNHAVYNILGPSRDVFLEVEVTVDHLKIDADEVAQNLAMALLIK